MNLMTWAALNMHIPLAISVMLYAWIAMGNWAIGNRCMAIAWLCYAAANIAFYADAITRTKT